MSFRSPLRLVPLLMLLAFLTSSIPPSLIVITPVAEAAIANNPPTQSYGSLVECLKPGVTSLYATTCFGAKWTAGPYGVGTDEYNAPVTDAAVVTFGDAKPDQTNSNPGEDSTHLYPAALGEVGSVYGLAYRSQSKDLFTSAYVKRITRFGPGGPGAIYILKPLTPGFAQQIITVPGADAGVPDNTVRAQHDAGVVNIVGRAGLGDLAISPDETRLLVVNLSTRALHQYRATAPYTALTSNGLPPATAGCPAGDGDFQPFGVTERRVGTLNQIFVSFVCSGLTRSLWSDVRVGALLSTDGGASWSRVAFTTIDQQHNDPAINAANPERWTYWRTGSSACQNEYHCPQPMATAVDFTYDGRMVIGLRDRFGDATMSFNDKGSDIGIPAGDVILLAQTSATSWGTVVLAGDGNEYLKDNNTHAGTVDYEHQLGAAIVVPGTHTGGVGEEVVTTIADGYGNFTGHIAWFDYGVPVPSQVTRSGNEEIYVSSKANFGKAAGLGDLAILCAWAQIGNRVWIDANGNGVQDAGEANVPGVVLRVTQGSQTIDVTTDSTGNWDVFIDPFQPANVQVISGIPAGYGYTTPNAGGDDLADSDADITGHISVPVIGFNEVYDPSYDIGLVNTANVHVDKSAPATVVRGAALPFTITYGNDGPAAAQNVIVVDTLPMGVDFVSASPAPASVSGQTLTWNVGTLAAGANSTITVNTTVRSDSPLSLANTVTISTTTSGDTPGDNSDQTTTIVIAANVYVQKSGPATITAGAPFAYTLNYGNNGGSPASSVVLMDTLPAGLTFVSASPAPSTVNGQTLTWNLGTLAAGSTGSITIQVQSSAALANGTVLQNTATITTPTPGDTPGDNISTIPTVVQRADVAVTKSSPTTFPVLTGSTVTYSLDYTNNGPAAAANVVLQDLVPAQLTSVQWSCSSGCNASGTGNAISINLGTLAAGQSGRVTVTGIATTSLAREDFTNTATISTSTPETRTDNNQSTVPGAVWTMDLQIAKLADAQAIAGTTFGATLTYRNNGLAPAAGVVIVDTLPTGISFVSATRGGVSFPPASVSGQVVTWNLGTIADQQGDTITLVLRADPAIANNTTVLNTVRIGDSSGIPPTDRDGTNNTSSAPTVILSRADSQVTKTGPARVNAGANVTFTIVYTNAGPSLARNVIVTDTLPGELDYVSASPTPTSHVGSILTWNVGDLAVGTGGTLTVQMTSRFAQVVASLPVTNTVVIDSRTIDPTPENNSDDHQVVVETADLSVIKTMPPIVVAGRPFTATVVWRNAGPATARNVTLRDLLPTNPPPLQVLSTVPVASGPGLRWNLGDVAAGVTGTITVRLLAPTSAVSGTRYLNTAVIDTAVDRDRDPSNDIDDDDSIVRPLVNLVIEKVGPPGPLRSGSMLDYAIRYRNDGPSLAQAVQVVDTPPPGFTFQGAIPAPSIVAATALTWNVGDLAAGASGTITVRGTLIGAGAHVVRTNTVVITTPTDEERPDDNTAHTDTIVDKPDLEVRKDDGRSVVWPGDRLAYTITARNTGLYTATGVILTETPPAGVTVVSTDWTAGANGVWTQSIGTLIPGAVVSRTFVIALPNPYAGSAVRNTVRVDDDGGSGPDPTPENNTDTDIDTLQHGRLGDYIWIDTDKDGVQDTSELPLPYVTVQLLDATGAVIATTQTDTNGRYTFEGLRLDETYSVRIDPDQLLTTPLNQYLLTTPAQPSTTLTVAQPEDLTLDIGMGPQTTIDVLLRYLRAERGEDGRVLVRWGTVWERTTAAFRVLRGTSRDAASATHIATRPSAGSTTVGSAYEFVDANAPTSGALWYWLVEVERDGTQTTYGPIALRTGVAATDGRIYLPLIRR